VYRHWNDISRGTFAHAWPREHIGQGSLSFAQELTNDQTIELLKIVISSNRHNETCDLTITIWSDPFVYASHDPQPEEKMLHLLRELARRRIVGCMTSTRQRAISLPQSGEKNGEILVMKCEHFLRETLGVSIHAPEPQALRPLDHTIRP
jgi:hypothetical protein